MLTRYRFQYVTAAEAEKGEVASRESFEDNKQKLHEALAKAFESSREQTRSTALAVFKDGNTTLYQSMPGLFGGSEDPVTAISAYFAVGKFLSHINLESTVLNTMRPTTYITVRFRTRCIFEMRELTRGSNAR